MFTESEHRNMVYRGYNPEFVKAAIAKKKEGASPALVEEAVVDAELEQMALPFWALDIVRSVAIEYNVLPSDMVGRSRKTMPAYARRKAMYEILKCTPILTPTQIGKWFGGRDWWTVAAIISGYSLDNGAPKLLNFDLETRREKQRERDQSRRHRSRAKQ